MIESFDQIRDLANQKMDGEAVILKMVPQDLVVELNRFNVLLLF